MTDSDETVVPLRSGGSERRSEPPATRSVRRFPQARAQKTYERLLDAAGVVFAAKGYDEAQTPDIAKQAGVSVGTFYRYFADKRQVFIEMITEHLETAYARILERLQPEDFSPSASVAQRRAAVQHALDVLFAHAAEHPDIHRVFLGMSLRDVEVSRIRADFETKGRDMLAMLIATVCPSSRVPDPVAAAEVLQIAASEVAIFTVGGRGDQRTPVHADAVRGALADMIGRWLFWDEGEQGDAVPRPV